MANPKKRSAPDQDWDPQGFVFVRNKTSQNILLDLPTGAFRLDAGRSFRMTPDIKDVPQIKNLVAQGQVEVSQKKSGDK
ncbi:MAG: hypothetical protein WAT12_00385 [Candidatus Nitrotoga sp.]